MVRVFGIGLGLFLMSILWPTAILLYMFSRRAKPPVTTFGVLSIVVMTLLTIVLILIPRQSDTSDEIVEVVDRRAPDMMSLFRPLIIIINIIALLFGLIVIYYKYVCKQIIRPKLSELNIKTVKPFIR